MYEKGEGVPKNFIEAYVWFLLAKANGDEISNKVIFGKVVSIHEERLTAEQIEKGQARAVELHRLYGAK